ncbi:very short patch repair endonuclease [Mesorhizobium erdmanii]|uniref:Very short patch repair endonuclease n=2 Tax=Mesorhizobium TaxID=68287 RepID=A0A3M9XGF8_9HYPH|nr:MULTISPECIES: DNA mismatch endonuclease Vsr [Mesorhizobium]RNJ47034.1 very short patch repair endonuclease [Mesorhizobium japonicum]RXT33963.1 very short patch repair endonuclease [Mesorhizobium erdmanii]
MVDLLTPQRRSWLMSRVGRKDTGPEIVVRRLLFREGYRFRLHRKEMPGSPDIVLPRYKVAIFVHGCFWHRHPGCSKATTPKTRAEFWSNKFAQNVARDKANEDRLAERGWRTIVVWECETKELDELREKLCAELEDAKRTTEEPHGAQR